MSFLQRNNKNHSSGYFGDLLFPVGELPAEAAVTMWILEDEMCLLLRRGKEDTKIPYWRILSFKADNEPRIRDGESSIPPETLANLPDKSTETVARMEQSVRPKMTTRWFGELQYLDEEGAKQYIYIMERKRSGYYLDLVKSLQAIEMEKYVRELTGAEGVEYPRFFRP